MFQRRPRRFRRHSNGRGYHQRSDGMKQKGMASVSLSNIRGRNNFRKQESAEKLAEKYNAVAKEALSSGDKTLSESYLQHADHFMRVISERSLNQSQNKIQVATKSTAEGKELKANSYADQEKFSEAKEEKKE